jgi:hypothetical protein
MTIPGSEPRARVAWAFLNDFITRNSGCPLDNRPARILVLCPPRTRHASSKLPRSLFSSLMLRAAFNGCIRGPDRTHHR